MPLLDTPNPTTYTALLNTLRDDFLPFNATQDDIHRIRHVTTLIANLQANYTSLVNCRSCGDKAPLAPYVRHLIRDLEALGVRGWVLSLEERLSGLDQELEQVEQALEQVDRLTRVESELREEVERLEEHAVMAASVAARLGDLEGAGLQRTEDLVRFEEEIEKLKDITERLERLVGDHPVEVGHLSEDDRVSEISAAYEHESSENEAEICGDESGGLQEWSQPVSPDRTPRPFSETSVNVETGSSGAHSPTTSAVDASFSDDCDFLSSLRRLSTEGGQEDNQDIDKDNAERLEKENKAWEHEQKELRESPTSYTTSTSHDHQTLATPIIDASPSYIFIPLPANFTLPQHNAHLPSLTFKTPPSVFHFPEGAKKDQLLVTLHQRQATGLPIDALDSLEDINVMQVRTHQMEWELKNAIRKTMNKEQWETNIGETWYTEGKGDTYIVSKRDVHFHGVSGIEDEEHQIHNNSLPGLDNAIDKEEGAKELPHLRGGASSPTTEDRERRPFAAFSSSSWFPGNADLYHGSADVDEANTRDFKEVCMECARMLQLENASLNRLVERLQNIIKDMEETFSWQDNVLDVLHHRSEHWKYEATKEKENATKAREEADEAREETEEFKALLECINEQVGEFYEQLETKLEEIEGVDEPRDWIETGIPSLRGGAGSESDKPGSIGSTTKPDDEEESADDIDANAFYFFTGVSTMVLLTTSIRSFQWPRHTTLVRAREILNHRHANGLETNPYLNRIREIMKLREEMGIPLPDTNQVFIALPEQESKVEVEGADGSTAKWESRFGPDDYEFMLRAQLDVSMKPENNSQGRASPSNSENDETRSDAGDLGGLIEARLGTICTPLESCEICKERGRVYSPSVKSDTQNTYATAPPNTYSGTSKHKSPSPTTPSPTTIPSSILYPSTPQTRPTLSRKATKSVVPERSEHFHPARMPEERMWNIVRYPQAEGCGSEYTECELDWSANYDYELGVGGQNEVESNLARSKFKAERDWEEAVEVAELEKWRHRKGEGCESWIDEAALDPQRKTCTFCDLEWAEGVHSTWEFANEWWLASARVRTPVNTRGRSSPKGEMRMSPDSFLQEEGQLAQLEVAERQDAGKSELPEDAAEDPEVAGQFDKDNMDEWDGKWRDL